jgi:hypothetical protein
MFHSLLARDRQILAFYAGLTLLSGSVDTWHPRAAPLSRAGMRAAQACPAGQAGVSPSSEYDIGRIGRCLIAIKDYRDFVLLAEEKGER